MDMYNKLFYVSLVVTGISVIAVSCFWGSIQLMIGILETAAEFVMDEPATLLIIPVFLLL